jgi:2-polyprenyl-6-methoxyphenol hydroxylase-like FAD-dependent oxidoreductase
VHDPQVLIVGAGIAGLSLGRALLWRGFSVEIVERATAWAVSGAGLYLPGNGVRAIAALGLADALMARAARISHQRILDHRGRLLTEIDLQRVWGHVGPCVGIRRADLHRMLVDGAAGASIRLSTTITAVTQTAETVSVQFDDGGTCSYDVLIGADGINSSIRRLVFGDVQPRLVGQISWRFIARETHGMSAWTAMLARGRTFLMIPVGQGGLYCYADLTTNETRLDPDRLPTLFSDFGEPVRASSRDSTPAMRYTPVRSRKWMWIASSIGVSSLLAMRRTRRCPTWRRAPRWRSRTR